MKGDFHVRFRENLRVKLPWVTRLCASQPLDILRKIRLGKNSSNREAGWLTVFAKYKVGLLRDWAHYTI